MERVTHTEHHCAVISFEPAPLRRLRAPSKRQKALQNIGLGRFRQSSLLDFDSTLG